MIRAIYTVVIFFSLAGPAFAAAKDAKPLGVLLADGGKVVASSDKLVWVETETTTYMCVIELSRRFDNALRYRRVRELYDNWPRALCFNAKSFE